MRGNLPATIASVKLLGTVLAVQVVLGLVLVALVATDNLPFVRRRGRRRAAPRARPTADRFDSGGGLDAAARAGRDGAAAGRLAQLAAARAAAAPTCCRTAASRRCPAACATWSARCPGASRATSWSAPTTTPRTSPASWAPTTAPRGTAVVTQLARTLKRPRHTIKFILFDGEETPRGTPDRLFAQRGLRGAKVAAPRYRDARAMVLLDFVADRRLSIPREGSSDRRAVARACARPRAPPASGATSRPSTQHDPGRPPPVPPGGRAVDRPDRLRLPLLAPALRRPVAPSRSAAWTRPGRPCTASSLASEPMAAAPEKLLLAAPRGYCAGVDRAVQTVERALELYGAARVRAQGDRAQQARGRAAARARRDLRGPGDRGARRARP